ncbi:K-homology type RNA binding protein [Handroanthus impetiginosus]|uniref:K-homology type RNA binding protein n=1 Tax=Handroanthus impetiginosus TaxID=429701 RepID=A0A2G9H6V2_9LAMI|nr:K-homology type RNA binding protein [Handroanthus impetiginosus]
MSEELLYASVGGESNKRKYEESPSPVTRRATGFSSPPDSAAPPPSYNKVPPPMNEIELAKQKAQEIAARLLNNADPLKRARVDNGGAGGGGYDSSDYGSQKPLGLGLSGPPQVASSGYPGPSKKIEIPNGRVGVIIGKGGETIKYLQLQSGAKIQVTRDLDADPNSATRGVELVGTPDQIDKAEQLINEVLSEAEAGGSGIVSRRVAGQPSGAEQFVMKIPNNKVGLVIGKGGETIKNMQARTGARIQVIPLHLPPGDTSKERTVQIDGTSEQIEAAKQLVEEAISENRVRNSSTSGGYPQQGYQTRPPSNWGHTGPPMQQPTYGYIQPGAYPGGPSPQYNMNQPPYSGYPPQTTSGGYATGWDQTTAAPQNQQAAQGGGYDYYNQQQPPQQQQAHAGSGAPTDSSGYGYGQAQAYSQGQGYGQDGYGGYHAAQSGYSQPQTNPGAGYDQQQQGYNSSYGAVPNQTADGHTPSYGAQGEANQAPASGQSYNTGGQPVPNSNYPPSSQPGYGAPPSSQSGYGTQTPTGYGSYAPPHAQKPPSGQPTYAQPQQSPGAQGGGYAQPGYPPSQQHQGQPGYAQTDSGSQRPPLSGYSTSQPGYGASPYGAPSATQPNYGQQQLNPYSSSYSGGYSQPPAYSSDATPSQSTQPSGSTKASPPS